MILHICATASLVYPPLTTIGKDCLEIDQTSKPGAAQRRTVMALKVELKPNERIIIGACMITNTDQRVRLHDRWHAEREEDVSGIPTRRPRAA
jgi:hypothetical protein